MSTTSGTPRSDTTIGLRLRSRLSTYTATPPMTASTATRAAISDSGSTGRSRRARLRRRSRSRPAKIPAATANSTQPTTGSSRPSALIARTCFSPTEMLVPPLMSNSITPWNARNAASVTTNDGMPIFATRKPMAVPITTPVARAARIARYHGTWCSVSSTARTAAHTPLV